MSGTERLARRSVAEQAADAIRAMIVSGELSAGQLLPAERQLAQELNISRPTLRQAISALSAMNIVESRHGGGTYVTSLTPDLLSAPISFLLQIDEPAVLDLFEIRRVLEVSAASMAAQRASDAQLARFAQTLDEAKLALADAERFIELDFALHAAIIDATGNALYASLCGSVAQLAMDSRRITGASITVRRRAHRDHTQILAALNERDAAAAGEAMADHLDAMKDVFVRAVGRDK